MSSFVIPNTSHEFNVVSWWAANSSGTLNLYMVDEESGHRPVWGISPEQQVTCKFGKHSVSAIVRKIDQAVGLFESPSIMYELEIKTQASPEQVLIEARKTYDAVFKLKGVSVFYTRKNSENNVSWNRYGFVPGRPISSLHLQDGLASEILEDAKRFLSPKSATLYKNFGRPYKRVYCLHGPPGTGKTSLVFSIASELDKSIAIFNVDSLRDDTFIELMSEIPTGAIVIFEDVDALFKTRQIQGGGGGLNDGGMTMSTLLNTLDGVLHPRGSLIFMTTNHLDRLDPAIKRPGRVDRMLEIGLARSKQVAQMWEAAFPKGPPLPAELAAFADKGKGVSPAATSEALFQSFAEGPLRASAAILEAWQTSSEKKKIK